jgi:hypothetical protein
VTAATGDLPEWRRQPVRASKVRGGAHGEHGTISSVETRRDQPSNHGAVLKGSIQSGASGGRFGEWCLRRLLNRAGVARGFVGRARPRASPAQ